jgi:dTDP-4-dehydrorhamnose 3,5-epimerase
MIFTQTELKGAYIIELEKLEDERGYFARSWCQREFEAQGLDTRLVQCNISLSRKKGTLRGIHFQLPPFTETKLVRCTRGALFDVIIDLRPDSPSFLKWIGVELTALNGKMMYVPKGFAHGFQTLEDDTEVFYQMSEFYAPDYARGVRWNDPLLRIRWPGEVTIISAKDQTYQDCDVSQFSPLKSMVAHE